MINIGILNDDFIIVDRKSTASNSNTAVALVHNEYASVKTFEKNDNVISLIPQNDFIESIILNSKNVEIIGIIAGVFSTL